MAHINIRELSDGATAYQVRWCDAAGRARAKSFWCMEDAKAFKVEIERLLLRGTYVQIEA